jgi:uncharacterized membrane protein YesL
MKETGRRIAEIFSNDSLFGRLFGTAGDIILVNLLFLVCSVPVVTIGASLSAMNETFMEKRNGSDQSIPHLFFSGFRNNLKKSTLAWILFLAFILILATDIHAFGPLGPLTAYPVYILSYVLLLLIIMVSLWLFAIIPVSEQPLFSLIKKAFLLAAVNFPYTLVMTAATVCAFFITLLNVYTLFIGISVWIFFGFGLLGYLFAPLFQKGMEKWKNLSM